MLARHPLLTVFAFLCILSIGFYFMSAAHVVHISSSVLKKPLQAVQGVTATKTTPTLKPTASPTPTPLVNLVIYTDNGFSPASITIKKGDIVTFKNTSSSNMWVASNNFPTSKLYPGTDDANCNLFPIPVMFDECGGITNGKSWDFTFNNVGRWAYHNHLNPSDGGTIIVTAN